MGITGCDEREPGVGTEATNVGTMAGSTAAEGSKGTGVSADRVHEAGTSGGTEVSDVGASTYLNGDRVEALSCTVSKGTGGLGSREGKKLEVDSTGRGPAVGVVRGAAFLQKKSGKV